jgi:hypothetical protein
MPVPYSLLTRGAPAPARLPQDGTQKDKKDFEMGSLCQGGTRCTLCCWPRPHAIQGPFGSFTPSSLHSPPASGLQMPCCHPAATRSLCKGDGQSFLGPGVVTHACNPSNSGG